MNRRQRSWLRPRAAVSVVTVALAAWLLVPALYADDEDGTDQNARGALAVRLSSVDGQVSLSQHDQPIVDQAVSNTPLFEGTQIATGNDGKAEIQFDDGSIARLSPSSSFTLTSLRGQTGNEDAEIQLNGGLGYFEFQGGDGQASHLRVRFGDSVVTANGFTVIRVNLDRAPGDLAVFTGNAHLERGGNVVLDVHGGESLSWDGPDPNQYNLAESIEPDSWDAWNTDRDQALSSMASDRTAATMDRPDGQNPAWGDLDANGSWYDVPDQGYVWSPYEASGAGWDPYGNGYWMSTPGYGYAWVSAEPWGYMPYQCGAWNYYNSFGWGWAPGTCSPWWSLGGWRLNVGRSPYGYRPPIHPPIRRHVPGEVPRVGVNSSRTLIAVNHRIPAGNTVLPPRDPRTSVTIAGQSVQALRPLPTRPAYGSAPAVSHSSTASMNVRPAYVRPSGTAYGNAGASYGYRSGSSSPATGSSYYYRPAPPGRPAGGNMPAQHYSAPSAPAPHVSAPSAPAPHVSGGGGGTSHH